MSEIALREVREEDLEEFYEHQRDPLARALTGIPARERADFDLHWARIRQDPTVLIRTILSGDQVAGSILNFRVMGQPEIGYSLGRPFWGQGIATRALALFLNVVSERPLYARVSKNNPASRRVLEKNGFQIIGEDRFVPQGGELIEELVFRLDIPPEAE